jgi:hypothetical protein
MPRGRGGKKMRAFMRKETAPPGRSERHLDYSYGWDNRGLSNRANEYCQILIRVCKLCKIPLETRHTNFDINATQKKLVAFAIDTVMSGNEPEPEVREGITMAFAEKLIELEDLMQLIKKN